mmetsp:Transcript_9445/g.17783  ORF Transcript_9445/g.17783 Transcript_9445/m.17783 type:complete len:218 (+) Transcript_9445:673-1326(+)
MAVSGRRSASSGCEEDRLRALRRLLLQSRQQDVLLLFGGIAIVGLPPHGAPAPRRDHSVEAARPQPASVVPRQVGPIHEGQQPFGPGGSISLTGRRPETQEGVDEVGAPLERPWRRCHQAMVQYPPLVSRSILWIPGTFVNTQNEILCTSLKSLANGAMCQLGRCRFCAALPRPMRQGRPGGPCSPTVIRRSSVENCGWWWIGGGMWPPNQRKTRAI